MSSVSLDAYNISLLSVLCSMANIPPAPTNVCHSCQCLSLLALPFESYTHFKTFGYLRALELQADTATGAQFGVVWVGQWSSLDQLILSYKRYFLMFYPFFTIAFTYTCVR